MTDRQVREAFELLKRELEKLQRRVEVLEEHVAGLEQRERQKGYR